MLRQLRYARQRATHGMLEGLAERPDRLRMEEGLAWARFYHRAARSPLSGDVATRAARRADGTAADPLMRWLMAEIEEARKETRRDGGLKHYGRITREYIESLADLLRY